MAIKEYNYKTVGNLTLISARPKITLSEVRSRDGANVIFWDTNLKKYVQRAFYLLEKGYGYKDVKCIVSRGYSTKTYNTKIGGATKSLHVYKGSALDHKFTGINKKGKRVNIPSRIVCLCYQLADAPGIEKIDSVYVHVDTRYGRTGTWKAIKDGNHYPTVSTFVTKDTPRLRMYYKGKKYYVYGVRAQIKMRLKVNGKMVWVKDKDLKAVA